MNWYKTLQAGRGLYNQPQGDSRRQQSRGYGGEGSMESDIYHENEIVEGEHVRHLHELAKQKRFNDFNDYLTKLKTEGHSDARVKSMMSRAMCGIKL